MICILPTVFNFSKTEISARRVAFGSQTERKMFPFHKPPSKIGLGQGIRGDPWMGPGCHSADPVSIG